MRRSLAILLAAVAVVVGAPSGAAALSPPPAQVNLLANTGFEGASLTGWACAGSTTPTWGGHSGHYALTGTPTSTSTAECAQLVPVRPNSAYTLAGWVRGGYAFLGTEFGSTWAPPGATWTRLSTAFTTGPSTTHVRVHVHGWYAQSPFSADDLTLTGPDSPATVPAAPLDPLPSESTSHSVRLTWTGSPGAARYRIYEGSTLITTTAGSDPTVVLTGLTAGSSHTYSVAAVNTAGESARSASVTTNVMPAQSAPPYAPRSIVTSTPGPGQVWLAWEAVQPASDGYNVYRDGIRIAWTHGPAHLATDVPAGPHTFEVTALNSAGESPKSLAVIVVV